MQLYQNNQQVISMESHGTAYHQKQLYAEERKNDWVSDLKPLPSLAEFS